MRNSLSSFGEQNIKREEKQANVNSNANFYNASVQDDVMSEYNKIKNLSQEEATAKLYQEVFKQKQNGSFDFNNLLSQVEGLRGYLPEKDFENLKRMLNTLR